MSIFLGALVLSISIIVLVLVLSIDIIELVLVSSIMMAKLVVCSQVKEIKARFHIMRCISENVSSFRSQCYMSENWITSRNHIGVNIRTS